MGTGVHCTYRFETCLPDNCRISTSVVCNLPKVERTVRFCYPAQKNTKICNKYLFFSYLLCKFAYQFFDKDDIFFNDARVMEW